MKTRIICSLAAAVLAIGSYAQGGTKSPYSQYVIGTLSDQSQNMSRGMNGVGIGMRTSNQVNMLNPASYSAVDSITMLIDASLTAQTTNYHEGSIRKNGSLASFEYIVGSFRAWKNVGVTLGVLPISNVGYEYTTTTTLNENNGNITETYSGSGGLHEAFIGVGWRLFKPLSIGANIGYLWGDINRKVASSSTTYINSLQKQYSVSVSSYKADFGLQWEQQIGKDNWLTIGATYGLEHKLNADPQLVVINTNSTSSKTDTTSFKIHNGLKLPMMVGGGLSFNHANKLIVAADGSYQRWEEVSLPQYDNLTNTYMLRSGTTMARYKGSIGMEFTPNAMSRNFFNRLHYRVGAGYATPYYKINGKDGPSELSVSAGLGIPILNAWNTRSMVHISGQWVQTSATGFIKENSFRINVGVTFNERWFAKWKVE